MTLFSRWGLPSCRVLSRRGLVLKTSTILWQLGKLWAGIINFKVSCSPMRDSKCGEGFLNCCFPVRINFELQLLQYLVWYSWRRNDQILKRKKANGGSHGLILWHVRLEEAYQSNIQTAGQVTTHTTKLNQSATLWHHLNSQKTKYINVNSWDSVSTWIFRRLRREGIRFNFLSHAHY